MMPPLIRAAVTLSPSMLNEFPDSVVVVVAGIPEFRSILLPESVSMAAMSSSDKCVL